MQYVHKNVGVCSRETIIDIDETILFRMLKLLVVVTVI